MNGQNISDTADRSERESPPFFRRRGPLEPALMQWLKLAANENQQGARLERFISIGARDSSRTRMEDSFVDYRLPTEGPTEISLSGGWILWDHPESGGSENDSEVTSPSPEPRTGQILADARRELWRCTTWEELIRAIQVHLPTEIAQRLAELHDQPYDLRQGEAALNFDSVLWFADYCLRREVQKRPLMSVTPDGVIQGDWRKNAKHRVTIRFFPNGVAWIALRTPFVGGSLEVPTQLLLNKDCPVTIPQWAR